METTLLHLQSRTSLKQLNLVRSKLPVKIIALLKIKNIMYTSFYLISFHVVVVVMFMFASDRMWMFFNTKRTANSISNHLLLIVWIWRTYYCYWISLIRIVEPLWNLTSRNSYAEIWLPGRTMVKTQVLCGII